jgi:hypothetical protein
MKTLTDALNGLLLYWQTHPSGGNRAQLLSLALAQGFVEPVLSQWLDVFLAGLVDLGWIATADYDVSLAPKVAAIGPARAGDAARAVFDHLLESTLAPIDAENQAQALAATLALLVTKLANVDAGISQALSFPPSAPRDALVEAAQLGRASIDAQRAGVQLALDQVAV